MHPLLKHVTALTPCTDPDCEIHQIEVGLSEGTVDEPHLAFFIAGMQRAAEVDAQTLADLLRVRPGVKPDWLYPLT